MSRTSYPVDADLSAFLEGGGIDVSTLQTLFPDAIDAAISAFEDDTDRRPFLASSEESTRYFDPPLNRDCLLFCDDLAAEPSAVVYQPNGASAETLTLRSDYWLEPANALSKKQPLTQIRFRRRGWTGPLSDDLRQSIAITGRWGYATELPDSVWHALLGRAAYSLFAQLRQGVTGGRVSEKEGDVAIEYGTENWLQLLLPWVGKPEQNGMGGVYGQAVARYRKMGF